MNEINKASLLAALGHMFEATIDDVLYSTKILQGGTVGDVVLLSGEATTGHRTHPFSVVVKTQRQWDRHGDPNCWRREYDIYANKLQDDLPQTIKLPRCYLLEESESCTRIWMEHIDGKSGARHLHADELALAAERLGYFQAAFHGMGKRDLPYLRAYPAARSSFDLWWGHMKRPFSVETADFPDNIRRALVSYANRAEACFESFDTLPLTLCQGDVHHDNLILRDSAHGTDIYLIDWDCAGYGRMGEDAVDMLMEAFVYSDRDVNLLPEYLKRILEGYCRGAGQGGVRLTLDSETVRALFALAWGFRIASYVFYKENYPRDRCLEILRAMLEEA